MTIEYGYDRKVRSWNTVVIDNEGNIIESDYSGNMNDVKWTINYFKTLYDIKEVVKIKAY